MEHVRKAIAEEMLAFEALLRDDRDLMEAFFDKIKKKIEEQNRPLLIFPQGTRVKFGEQPPFKKGIGRIYDSLGLPCIPVALNTGKVWPKNSFMKFSGDIHISFLEPILPGKEKNDFLKEVENKIYLENKKFI